MATFAMGYGALPANQGSQSQTDKLLAKVKDPQLTLQKVIVPEYQEQFQKELFDKLQAVSSGVPFTTPDQMVAGFDPMQLQAMQLAQQGVGSYLPYLTSAQAAYGAGLGSAGQLGNIADQMGIYGGQAAGMGQSYADLAQQYAGQAGLGYGAAQQAQLQAQQMAGQTGLGYEAATGAAKGMQDIVSGLGGGAQMYDPTSVSQYMNPYEQEVIDRAMADIQRAGDIQAQSTRAQAVGSGAFGGSRAALQEAELGRNVLEQQAKTAAGVRQAGYQQAQEAAQKAFEAQQARQLQAGQLGIAGLGQAGALQQKAAQDMAQLQAQVALQGGQLTADQAQKMAQLQSQMAISGGQLGLSGLQTGLGAQEAMGSLLGQQAGLYGTLGTAQAELGQLGQGLNLRDIQMLTALGEAGQQLSQAQLDALYANQLSAQMDPYRALQIQSDIFSGIPSSQTVMGIAPGQQIQRPSTAQTLAGLGIAALGAFRGFGNPFAGG